MTYARDKWVLARLEQIQYLFSKAHTLEYIFFCLKAKRFVTLESSEERDMRYLNHGRLLEELVPQIECMDDDIFRGFIMAALRSAEAQLFLMNEEEIWSIMNTPKRGTNTIGI